ncbi:MAG: VanW family protein [Butyricicoccus sp.]
MTERHNHSFTVSYTPLGEDATVDYGNLDFRFVNNTAYPVKILAEQTDSQMIMTIVGTKTSDKTVDPHRVLETYKPETVTKTDSSMEAGDSRVGPGHHGLSTKTYKQITENGKTTEVLANSSTYSKRDEVVYVGE